MIPDEIKKGAMYPFDSPDRIEIIPDWERVREHNLTDPEMRKEWFWMNLPVYFGYPRAESPFSTIVNHVDLGNLAVLNKGKIGSPLVLFSYSTSSNRITF